MLSQLKTVQFFQKMGKRRKGRDWQTEAKTEGKRLSLTFLEGYARNDHYLSWLFNHLTLTIHKRPSINPSLLTEFQFH